MVEDVKRLFFGFSVEAPWPHHYPKGRIIDENFRHVTFAFLGNVPFPTLEKMLPQFPKPKFSLGPVGRCDQLLFLPKFKARVVAGHVSWLLGEAALINLQKGVLDWLEHLGYKVDRRPLLPHITLARAPFEEKQWKEAFEEFPCIVTGIHLYESVGNLTYHSIWELPLQRSFEEIEHTADIAFHIRGKSPYELYVNGAIAMSFKFPQFLQFIDPLPIDDLDQVVKRLNIMIAKCDLEIGCPFKAVSYHSKITKEPDGLTNWEMIVDV